MPIPTQQTHNVAAKSWHCSNIVMMLLRCCVFARYFLGKKIKKKKKISNLSDELAQGHKDYYASNKISNQQICDIFLIYWRKSDLTFHVKVINLHQALFL